MQNTVINFYETEVPAIAANEGKSDAYIQEMEPAFSWRAWIVVLTASLLFFYEFVQLNMLNSISSQLMQAYHINAEQLGHLSAMYLYADAMFIFVAGMLLDRFSTRRLILGAMVVCTIGTFGFALAPNIWWAGVFRFCSGLGGAFCFLGCVRLATRWFSPQKMAFVTGMIITMAMLGGLVAQAPFTYLVGLVGWRHAILIDACFGVVIIALIFFIVTDRPKSSKPMVDESHSPMSVLHSIRIVIKNAQNWFGGIYTCLMNLPVILIGALWGTGFLTSVAHLSLTKAASVSSMVFIGTIFGSPLMGYFSDKIQSRKIPMFVGALLSLGIILIVMYAKLDSVLLLGLLFFGLGLFSSSQVISYPLISEHNPSWLTGTSVGIVSMTTIFGGGLLQPLFGRLMDYHWHGVMLHNAPVYTGHDYMRAMLILPVSFVIAFSVVFLLKETNCIHRK